jgi:hypothetical protein
VHPQASDTDVFGGLTREPTPVRPDQAAGRRVLWDGVPSAATALRRCAYSYEQASSEPPGFLGGRDFRGTVWAVVAASDLRVQTARDGSQFIWRSAADVRGLVPVTFA